MSLKDSMKCLVPPSNPTTLEAKVDDLHFKLEQLLTRSSGRGCPMCGMCAQHSTLQEVMTSQLSAHTRLLDSLERKVLEMRTALEDLARGLEDRLCDNVSLPLVALQRRKSLPVRNSAEEVYVCLDTSRDRKITSHALNVASEKGILLEVNENNGVKRENYRTNSSEVKIQNEVKLSNTEEREKATVTPKSSTSHPHQQTQNVENKNSVKTPAVAPVNVVTQRLVASRSPSPKPEVQNDKTVLPPNSKLTKTTTTSVSARAAATSSGAIVMKYTDAANEILPQSHTVPKTIGPVTPAPTKTMASDTTTLVPSSSPKPTLPEVPTASSPNHNTPKANLVPPAQSFGKSPENTPTTKTAQDSMFPPSHTPPNTMGLPVTTATKEASFLRQVQSCPNSLQRIQVNAGTTSLKAPLEKRGTEVSGAAKQMTGGIQIKISPAAAEKTPDQIKANNPPRTCFKVIDDVPPQPAPFSHRFVSLKSNPPPCDTFSIHTTEVLGGGRFGKVHKCTENKTMMRLAAKIINTRNAKERDLALNEIQVMNQISHPNVLQLYEAFELKNQVVLILEYVEGGELFERIVDDSSPLTEVDAMVFVKQICEGVQYMHQMYVLHLDLKPENILLVNHSSHQVKIIDFGLARRYKPREKLKVSFGTPEFLAPEVVNFDFVSFPTDMWTLGVVTYMLLSGLSPFLGDDDSQTLNNVLMGNWYFDEDAFEHVSAEARDFVSNLLIRERSGRLSAAQCLKHPWLNNISEKAKHSNIVLKSQVLLKKYIARRMWKKNYIAIAAANRFKKIGSSGSLTSLGI